MKLAENIEYEKGVLKIAKRTLTPEDELAIDFSRICEDAPVEYVLVGGYIAILLGRARRTEDVDVVIRADAEAFRNLVHVLATYGYRAIQGSIPDGVEVLYRDYLARGLRVRFYKGAIIPNVEVKLSSDFYDEYTLSRSMRVELAGRTIRVSPPEMAIAYKLYLGSRKDLEDSAFIYRILRPIVNESELLSLSRRLGVEDKLRLVSQLL
ncbi:hypothetical protein IG193_01210 [Infirmifilum lucidum]|uniref:Uncharacterized protein n=1 Tax=Infirmifilum lucidum TaxID=2776706 RepID=A0A7L9FJY9_9CREN|nr:hypothetical protein [Infirmifilum lucidum]QOJ79115.1 hypothetical protein IG193_01210 [Infirmifilum lucidum]